MKSTENPCMKIRVFKNSVRESCKLHLPRLNMLEMVKSLSAHSGAFIVVFQPERDFTLSIRRQAIYQMLSDLPGMHKRMVQPAAS